MSNILHVCMAVSMGLAVQQCLINLAAGLEYASTIVPFFSRGLSEMMEGA